MALNTDIALQTRTPESRSPLQTLGALNKLREDQELSNSRRLLNETRQRDLDDDYAVRESLQMSGGNPDAAVEMLWKGGRGKAATTLLTSITEQRKSEADARRLEYDNTEKRLKLAAQIAQSINDETSFQGGKKAIVALLGQEAGAALGDTYDPKRVQGAVKWGTSRQEQISIDKQGIDAFFKAWDTMLTSARNGVLNRKDQVEIEKNYMEGAGKILSTARSQAEWDEKQRLLSQSGIPATFLAQFGNEWSPAAVENATRLAMDAKQYQDVKHQRSQDGLALEKQALDEARETRIAEDADNRERRLAGGGGQTPGQRPITATRESAVHEGTEAAYQTLEKELREKYGDPITGKLSIPKEAEPEIAKRKVQIEDGRRRQLGQKPMMDTMNALAAKLKTEKDPARAERIKAELAELREHYRRLTGR